MNCHFREFHGSEPPGQALGFLRLLDAQLDELLCFGVDSDGQLEVPSYEGGEPITGWRSVSVGGFHGCGVLEDDSLECWGSDYYGQTVHPRFGGYRDASLLWEATETNHTAPELRWLPRRLTGAGGQALAVRRQHPRMVYAHRYVGARDEAAERHLMARVEFTRG